MQQDIQDLIRSSAAGHLWRIAVPDAINGQTPKPNDDVGWMQVLDNGAEILAKFGDKKMYNGHIITV